MVNSGRSAAKGSDRKPRLSTVPAFLGRPPVQAGMVPAALPAFSAPSGVRVVPSLAASDSDTAAITLPDRRESANTPVCIRFLVFICVSFNTGPLEVHTEAQGHEVAVVLGGVLATEEVGVRQVHGVGVLIVGVQAHADGLAAFLEVAARAGGITLDVMGPGQVRLQVHTQEGVRVFPDSAQTIAPGVGGGEAVVFAEAAEVTFVGDTSQSTVIQRLTHIVRQEARPEGGVAAIARHARIFQTANVSPADLTDQGHARGAHELVNEVGEGRLYLGDFFTAITRCGSTRLAVQHRYPRHCRIQTTVENVGGVQLHRSIVAVADLALPGCASGKCGGEAYAVKTDIFRVLNKVLTVSGQDQGGQARSDAICDCARSAARCSKIHPCQSHIDRNEIGTDRPA